MKLDQAFESMRSSPWVSRQLVPAACAAGNLKQVAWADEVAFYPTIILNGEYLKLRFADCAQAVRV
jgi:hypothetical protein